MAKMVCKAGPTAGHEYTLNRDKVMFGRQRTCDVQIMDSMASREHFLIRRDGNLYTLVDLESRNGTHLNERKITERQLEFGDVVRVGEVEFIFVKEEGDTDLKDLLTKKYVINEKIGEGGMGIVYKALQKSMERTVALKILTPKFSSRPRFVEQFIKEARAAGALNHPNIIQVHDVASENGVHYFSMEYIDGPTAMSLLKDQGALPQVLACEIVRQTAKALSYAHENRIIHRDIKPENIMLTSTEAVKLADLGISKTFDEAEAEGKPKRIAGTPHYMAPEASLGNKIDHRIDIYSLGVTFYHLLSGQTPFDAVKASEVLKAHVRDEPEALESLSPDLHPEVIALCNDMMRKDPDERLSSANEVANRAKDIIDLISSNSDAGAGGETIMVKRMMAPASNSEEKTKIPTNVNVRNTTARSTAGNTASKPSREIQRHRRRKEANPTTLILRIILFIFALTLGWIAFSYLKDKYQPTETPAETQEAPNQTSQTPVTAPVSQIAGETSTRDNEDIIQLGRRLENAYSTVELASIVEDAHGILRNLDQSDSTNIQRLNTIITSANQRLSDSQNSAATAEFNDFEGEINALLAQNEFQQAEDWVNSYQATNSESIQERKQRLRERIVNEQNRYLKTLEQQINRFKLGKNISALRNIRSELPAAMLSHPIANTVNEAIREVESTLQAESTKHLTTALEHLYYGRIDDFNQLNRQLQTLSQDPDLQTELKRLNDISQQFKQATDDLNTHLRQLDRKPRYRGNLRGLQDPDIIGSSEKGIILGMASGGQSSVPWHELKPAMLRNILSLSLAQHTNPDAISSAFAEWAKTTRFLRQR